MKFKQRILELISKERATEVDEKLLTKLREFALDESLYGRFTPEATNALNDFFSTAEDTFFKEVLTSPYSPRVILEAMMVLCFEVGYKTKEWELIDSHSLMVSE
ncbi:MAG: hypothetical protein WC455_22020 [Dehalococcoidia bacterium]|jgi:hypothetical protein